jgi:hypothetical protein
LPRARRSSAAGARLAADDVFALEEHVRLCGRSLEGIRSGAVAIWAVVVACARVRKK